MRLSDQPVYVYRGLHSEHPMLESARHGIVIPGDVDGTVTAWDHNLLPVSGISPFTSWSFNLDIANRYATNYGGGGVVLRLVYQEPTPDDSWNWEESPDEFAEEEILLRGIRIGVEVIRGGRPVIDP